MAHEIVASFPVTSRLVPACLENIIDKKVSSTALNCIERLIHFIFSWIYLPYSWLFDAKMARVHTFRDGIVKLYDSTVQGVGWIDPSSNHITLHHRKICFNADPNRQRVFSRGAFTDYVVLEDHGQSSYQIIEKEISRLGNPTPRDKIWTVSINESRTIPIPSQVFMAQ